MKHNVQDMEKPAVELRCCTCQTRSRIRPKSLCYSESDEELSREVFDELLSAVERYRLAWHCRHCRTTTEQEVVRLTRKAAAKRATIRAGR